MPNCNKHRVRDNHSYEKDITESGRNLRTLREEAGLSLDDLARLIDSDKSHLSKIENGGQVPKLDTVFQLMDALHVSPSVLMPSRFQRDSKNKEWEHICSLYANLPESERDTAIRYIRALLVGLLSMEREQEAQS